LIYQVLQFADALAPKLGVLRAGQLFLGVNNLGTGNSDRTLERRMPSDRSADLGSDFFDLGCIFSQCGARACELAFVEITRGVGKLDGQA
jgi:hypothetical protein